eukprot:SAG11_NODE_623_length_8115_cov_51.423278_7_plen_132_part_00
MARAAVERLAPGGVIVLDNSGWYPDTCKLLREIHGFTQLDFHGLKPAQAHADSTAIFTRRGDVLAAETWGSSRLRQHIEKRRSDEREYEWKSKPAAVGDGASLSQLPVRPHVFRPSVPSYPCAHRVSTATR